MFTRPISRRATSFGRGGTLKSQPRAVAEFGFIFGNNIVEKKP